MSPQIYPAVYYGFLLLLACLYVFTYARAGNDFVYKRSLCNGNRLGVIIVTLLCALFLGTRPIDPFFSDTVTYATWYKHIQIVSQDFFEEGDRGFRYFMLFCSNLGLGVSSFFVLVDIIYMGAQAYILYQLFRKNAYIASLSVLGTFFFYNFAVNGIRNGLALSLILLAIYYYECRKKTLGLALTLLALSIHISTIIIVISYWVQGRWKYSGLYIKLWCLCLILSIICGSYFNDLFTNIGILDNWHSAAYFTAEGRDMSLFTRTGYRWDFLLFSLPPIIWGYVIIIRKGWKDQLFVKIYNMYVFINAFWLLVNMNWLSNRIVMLSWVFYSYIFIYPMLRMEKLTNRILYLSLYTVGSLSFAFYYNVYYQAAKLAN